MPALLDYSAIPSITLGPLRLYTWGLFVGLGVFLAAALAARRARAVGVAPEHVWRAVFWVVLAGIAGARILFLAEYGLVRYELGEIVAIWEGGLSAFGAVGGGVLAGLWYAQKYQISPLRLAWAAAPTALLGDAAGRLGGAASHMYPGTPTAFALSYTLGGVQRHEVGIELALASFAGFLVILAAERWWWKGGKGNRQQATGNSRDVVPTAYCLLPVAFTLLWYSAERFFLDFLRASDLPQSDLRYGGLTLAQILALLGGIIAISLLARWRVEKRQSALTPML